MADIKQRVEKSKIVLESAMGFMKKGEYYSKIPINDIEVLNTLLKELTEREAKLVEVLKAAKNYLVVQTGVHRNMVLHEIDEILK